MRRMRMVLLAMAAAAFSGCASAYKVSDHNAEVRAIRLKAGSGGVMAGVDLAALSTGYFAAWGQDPWGMALATGLDAALVAGAYYGVNELLESSGSDRDESAPRTIESGGGQVIVITGDGNSVNGNASPVTEMAPEEPAEAEAAP